MSLRVVFMGTPDYGVPSLKALLDAGYDVAGVFCQPDKPSGRGKKITCCPVKQCAGLNGIPVFQPVKTRVDGVAPLRELAPDLCVTAAFGHILSQEVLDIPRLGTVNVHASLLPKYRGSAPVNWALINGETVTGVTTMMTDKGMDTGDTLSTRRTTRARWWTGWRGWARSCSSKRCAPSSAATARGAGRTRARPAIIPCSKRKWAAWTLPKPLNSSAISRAA